MRQGGSVGSPLTRMVSVCLGLPWVFCTMGVLIVCSMTRHCTLQQELCQSLLQLYGSLLAEELHWSPHAVDCPPRLHAILYRVSEV